MSRTTERWILIPGTDGFYSASNLGRIRSEPTTETTAGRQRGRILSPKPNPRRKGYLCFRLCVPGRPPRSTTVHQAVALAFIGPCPDGMQVNHKDGNKANNRPRNLEYVSCKENVRHGWKTGLHEHEDRKGEANNVSKLTESIVTDIRRRYPRESLSKLAAEFGVTKQCIWFVVKRKTWDHIP